MSIFLLEETSLLQLCWRAEEKSRIVTKANPSTYNRRYIRSTSVNEILSTWQVTDQPDQHMRKLSALTQFVFSYSMEYLVMRLNGEVLIGNLTLRTPGSCETALES